MHAHVAHRVRITVCLRPPGNIWPACVLLRCAHLPDVEGVASAWQIRGMCLLCHNGAPRRGGCGRACMPVQAATYDECGNELNQLVEVWPAPSPHPCGCSAPHGHAACPWSPPHFHACARVSCSSPQEPGMLLHAATERRMVASCAWHAALAGQAQRPSGTARGPTCWLHQPPGWHRKFEERYRRKLNVEMRAYVSGGSPNPSFRH